MPRQVDYYFSFQSPWAYIGHKPFRDRRKNLRSEGESQAGGAGRSVLGDRRPAADEAPSGAAALPDGRVAALARQARPEIPSAAGELAVQRAAGRWRGDRGDRGRPRSRAFLRRAFAAVWEDQLNLADPATIAKLADDPGFPASNWWSDRDRTRSARPMSRTARTRWPPTCSARRSMCSMARCSGDRTGSNCWADALKSGRAPYRSQV
jgi:hypothetical protein